MSLKLIREATLVATLDKSELAALAAMKTGSRLQEADEKMQLWTADSGNYDAHHPERHKSIGYFKTQAEAKTALDKCPNKKMMGPVHSVAGYASWLKKSVNESFTPDDSDFDAWMRVIVGEAGDRGVNLNKKSQFMELAMDVLENDPASPPLDMQEMIAAKLWQDYNSAKNAVRINKLAQAKEEEEKVSNARKQIADRFAQGTTSMTPSTEEEEMGISDDLAARKIFNKIKGTPNLNFAVVQQYVNKYLSAVGKRPTDAKYLSALVYGMLQDAGMAEENEESGFAQALRTSVGMEDEEPSFVRDALRDEASSSMRGSFSSHLRGEDSVDDEFGTDEGDVEVSFGPDGVDGVDDDEVFTSDDECECPCADEDNVAADDELSLDDEIDDEDMDIPADDFDDETMDDVDADVEPRAPKKGFDEEEAVKSFFRQAVTSPNDMMRQAVKDIEEEGKTAWKKANVPSNPHPQKSQAYRAWQKGLLNAAKEALGIVDKPVAPKAKPKRKK